MHRQLRASIASKLILLLFVGTIASDAISQEFAVQNKVMQGPVTRNETRTLITPDAYYDVIMEDGRPTQVSVYLLERHQYYLLDLDRRISATIDDPDVRNFVAQVVLRAKNHENIHLRFAANPEFRQRVDGSTITLDSDIWTYTVQVKPSNDHEAVDAYRKFADSFARFNAFTSFPPNARIKLNQAIHKAKALPSQVEVRLADQKGKTLRKQLTLHEFDWTLSKSDRKVIDNAKRGIVEFKPVSLKQFHATSQENVGRTRKRLAAKPR